MDIENKDFEINDPIRWGKRMEKRKEQKNERCEQKVRIILHLQLWGNPLFLSSLSPLSLSLSPFHVFCSQSFDDVVALSKCAYSRNTTNNHRIALIIIKRLVRVSETVLRTYPLALNNKN